MRPWVPLLAGSACYVAALLWAALELPPEGVPMHVDAAGTPTRLGTRADFLALGALVGTLLVLVGAGTCLLATRGPLTALNVPHKQYWTHPQRVARLRSMLAHDMGWTFGVLLAFLAVVPVSAVYATRVQPPRLPAGPVWTVVGLLVAGLVVWCAWLARYRYRPS